MKKILTIFTFILAVSIASASNPDSTASIMSPASVPPTDTTTMPATTDTNSIVSADHWKTELTIATRNVFRGVSYAESPSMIMTAAWLPCKYVEIGTYGNMTLTGTKEGYGNQINTYVTFKPFAESKSELKNVSITSDDFFYFNPNDDDNNFFAWSKEKTQHFIEGRLKYDGKIDFTVGYTYWANKNANVDGIYFEGGYDVSDNFYIFAGYLTDQNDFMFQETGGWTNIGGTVTRKLNVKNCCSTVLKISLIASPNCANHSDYPGVGRNPISLVGSLTF